MERKKLFGRILIPLGILGGLAFAGGIALAQQTEEPASSLPLAPDGSCADAAPSIRFPIKNTNDLLTDVGERVPGFGGMYVDTKENTLNVYLTHPSDAAQVEAAQQAIGLVFGNRVVEGKSVQALQARYTLTQLKGWYDCLWNLPLPGVISRDVDEGENRLFFTVSDLTGEALEKELIRLGIPNDGFGIGTNAHVTFENHEDLQGEVDEPLGGVEVTRDNGGACTLGLVVNRNSVEGFITATHCSSSWWTLDNVSFFQPDNSDAAYEIGDEVLDPDGFTAYPCPSTRDRCRWADATFVGNDSARNFQLGYIAALYQNTAPFPISDTNVYRITSEEVAVVGTDAVKMGRSTGYTSGEVAHTCQRIDFTHNNNNWSYLCFHLADYGSSGGDSGAPVFEPTDNPNTNDVGILGIHSGRADYQEAGGVVNYAMFAEIFGLEDSEEFGSMTNCASGFSC